MVRRSRPEGDRAARNRCRVPQTAFPTRRHRLTASVPPSSAPTPTRRCGASDANSQRRSMRRSSTSRGRCAAPCAEPWEHERRLRKPRRGHQASPPARTRRSLSRMPHTEASQSRNFARSRSAAVASSYRRPVLPSSMTSHHTSRAKSCRLGRPSVPPSIHQQIYRGDRCRAAWGLAIRRGVGGFVGGAIRPPPYGREPPSSARRWLSFSNRGRSVGSSRSTTSHTRFRSTPK
jgi:hypothetical protein